MGHQNHKQKIRYTLQMKEPAGYTHTHTSSV